jgi:hypothetical protein
MSTLRIAARAMTTTAAPITIPIFAPLPIEFHAFVIPLVLLLSEAAAVFASVVPVAAAACEVAVPEVVVDVTEWVAVGVDDEDVVALEDVTEEVTSVDFVLVDVVADAFALAALFEAFAAGLELEIPNCVESFLKLATWRTTCLLAQTYIDRFRHRR